jgi:hypothetical protein
MRRDGRLARSALPMTRRYHIAERRVQTLYIVHYEDGRTAYLSERELGSDLESRPPMSNQALAIKGQRSGLIPEGRISSVIRAH